MSLRSIPRVLARLDIKGPNLVKGISFEGLRVLGKPELFAKLYYQEGADELIYIDAVASLYGRNSLLDVVRATASEIFIPLTVGGGLRSLEDIRAVLRAGADKVSLNTAAVARPELIAEAARAFGSSTIVVSVEAYRHPDGRYEAYVDYGREATGVDALEWAAKVASLGAGEILLTSVRQDGSGAGFDQELIQAVATRVDIPVIAGGGAGQTRHVVEAFLQGGADAVALGSMLHYQAIERLNVQDASYAQEGNVEFLRRGLAPPARLTPTRMAEVKAGLVAAGIPARQVSYGES